MELTNVRILYFAIILAIRFIRNLRENDPHISYPPAQISQTRDTLDNLLEWYGKIEPMMTYCDYCNTHPEDTFNKNYHDTQYGFPLQNDNLLFERLVFEINQAGLSWITILKKADNFRRAYDAFDIDIVAAYGEPERARLLADAGIIRNRLKINAAIENARRIQILRRQTGSFQGWLQAANQSGLSIEQWVKLFKKEFVFTGGEIVKEFLMSSGYLPGAHTQNCPIYAQILACKPAWVN